MRSSCKSWWNNSIATQGPAQGSVSKGTRRKSPAMAVIWYMLPQPPLVSTTWTSTGLFKALRSFSAMASSCEPGSRPAPAAKDLVWRAVTSEVAIASRAVSGRPSPPG